MEKFQVNWSLIVLCHWIPDQALGRECWIVNLDTLNSYLYYRGPFYGDFVAPSADHKNKIDESLALFQTVLAWFGHQCPFILFLNKMDIFEEKLKNHSKLSDHFEDYGPNYLLLLMADHC